MPEIPEILPKLYVDFTNLLLRAKKCPYSLSKEYPTGTIPSDLQEELKSRSNNFSRVYVNLLLQKNIGYPDTSLIFESIERARDLVYGNDRVYDYIESKLAIAAQRTVQEKGLEGLPPKFGYLLMIDPDSKRE